MPKKKYPKISLERCQIKSKRKLKLLCKCFTTLEEEFGIGEVEIYFRGVFVCPWIDLLEFSNSNDPMENLIGGLLIKMDIMKHGDKSQYMAKEDLVAEA